MALPVSVLLPHHILHHLHGTDASYQSCRWFLYFIQSFRTFLPAWSEHSYLLDMHFMPIEVQRIKFHCLP